MTQDGQAWAPASQDSFRLVRADERKLAEFLDEAAVPVHWLAPDGRVLWANKAELESLGYGADDYIGHHAAEFHPDSRVSQDFLRRLARAETLHDYPLRRRRRDGSVVETLVTTNGFWEDGRVVHTHCFSRDRLETALPRSSALARILARAHPSQPAAQTMAVAAAYFLTAIIGFTMAIPPGNVTAVWPPSGIALAAALLKGRPAWLGVWLGSFAANLAWGLTGDRSLAVVLVAASIAAGSSIQALFGAALVRRATRHVYPLERPYDVLAFSLSAAASCVIASSIGVGSLAAAGYVPSPSYLKTWWTWWVGDATGMLLVAPPLLALARHEGWGWPSRSAAEKAAFALILAAACSAVFGGLAKASLLHEPIGFVLIPLYIWAALRFSPVGVTASLLAISCFAVWGTLNGYGPYARASAVEALPLLQAYVASSVLLSLVLSSAIGEERAAAQALSHGYAALDALVRSRTDALSQSNRALAAEVDLRREAEEMLKGSHRQREQMMMDRAQELARANDELNQFTAVASHDLQAPLRKIIGFGEELESHLGAALDETGRDFLARMTRSAEQMQGLVRSLLAMAKVAAAPPALQGFAWEDAVREALSPLAPPPGQVSFGPGPALVADRGQIVQLLQNLISNALKFHQNGSAARVELSCRRQPDRSIEIRVSDHGVGFEPALAERLFKPFSRLHSRKDYEGDGLGLAICERIARRHRGTIQAKGLPGEGATFIVVLPQPPSEASPSHDGDGRGELCQNGYKSS